MKIAMPVLILTLLLNGCNFSPGQNEPKSTVKNQSQTASSKTLSKNKSERVQFEQVVSRQVNKEQKLQSGQEAKGNQEVAPVQSYSLPANVSIVVKTGLSKVQVSTPDRILGLTNDQGVLETELPRNVEDFLIAQKLGYEMDIIEVKPDGVQEILYMYLHEKLQESSTSEDTE